MKMKRALCMLLLTGCAANVPTIVMPDGVYRMIRPKSGANIELWSKDGVSTNDYVYMPRFWANGDPAFTRILP